ncbi:MAG: hypothetical protein OXN94_14715 [Chloroflexota bacterium]|nr:hypothetical protein [Chloroflexota bacterium]
MIRLSPRGKIQYQFLSLIVLLLLLYSLSFLLEALFQLPDNPLALHFDAETVKGFSARCLSLLILTGLVGAGITMASFPERVLQVFLRSWIALIIVTLIASPFLRVSFLDALTAMGLLALLALTRSGKEDSAFTRVWQAGLLLVCASSLAKPFASSPWDKVLDLYQWHVAYAVAALSVAFWLMTRFSTVTREWAQDGVKIVAALIFLGGSLISIAPLGLPPVIGISAAPLIVLCYTIQAGHAYRALSMRNNDMSLAPHWTAVATLFWLVAGGFLGAISLQAGLNSAMQGTALSEAQGWIMSWALLAILCAYLNSAAAELRGGNSRVTGYAPLWLIAFGAGLSTTVQGCRGVVEIYLRDSFALERARILAMTAPLTQIWILCLLAVAIGIMTFALGFWARRPKIQVDSP